MNSCSGNWNRRVQPSPQELSFVLSLVIFFFFLTFPSLYIVLLSSLALRVEALTHRVFAETRIETRAGGWKRASPLPLPTRHPADVQRDINGRARLVIRPGKLSRALSSGWLYCPSKAAAALSSVAAIVAKTLQFISFQPPNSFLFAYFSRLHPFPFDEQAAVETVHFFLYGIRSILIKNYCVRIAESLR